MKQCWLNIVHKKKKKSKKSQFLKLCCGYQMEKSAKAPKFSALKSSGERTADLYTKPAVAPAFIQFRLEFGETEILADLPRHW
jgi:hypothetical protein